MSTTLIYLDQKLDASDAKRWPTVDGYDVIVAPIVSPTKRSPQCNGNRRNELKHLAFSSSNILDTSRWVNSVISKIGQNIDCDSENEDVRQFSERTLIREILFAENLLPNGQILYKLNGSKCTHSARILTQHAKGTILIELPMIDPNSMAGRLRGDGNANEEQHENGVAKEDEERADTVTDKNAALSEDTWNWWNKFRIQTDFNAQIKIALEICGDIPSRIKVERWLGEPVHMLIIPANVFVTDTNNYPTLSQGHQQMIIAFLQHNIDLMVKCNWNDENVKRYSDYLKQLAATVRPPVVMTVYDDYLQIPLQPHYEDLDASTYEEFETDPIKYYYYQKAIELALIDFVSEKEIPSKTITIMIVGAGRGPLVRSALNAAANTGRNIKLFIIEKNPNAIITLTALIEEMWSDKDIELISCDMRDFVAPEKADILVSELLGSFGDNELSPECLDGAQKHLKCTGISIPSKTTSYINPLMSSKIYNAVRCLETPYSVRHRPNIYITQAETNYIVYIKNAYHIDGPKPVFEFVHPNKSECIDNSRFKTVKFEVSIDCILNGFAGYFDTVLYKDVILSIHPETHSRGLQSWFPIYFPMAAPQQLKAGDVIEVSFWRCVSTRKVWYEWNTTSPFVSHIHNHNGRSSSIKI